jgi:DNA-binding NarL/FixJ family response regulator
MKVLIIDDTPAFTAKIGDDLRKALDVDVVELHHLHELPAAVAAAHFDVAIVDLSFPFQRPRSGLDALLYFHLFSPTTNCAILSAADEFVSEMICDAWEAFDLATVLSKTRLHHTESVAALLKGETVQPDADARLLLPSKRNPARSLDAYVRLLPQHRGLHRLWRALIAIRGDVNPKTVAQLTGSDDQQQLSPSAIANYRQLVLPPLESHGLIAPTLIEMARFARRVRPLLLHAMGTPDLLDKLET